MYTVILILTCLVASPFIFKQIWVSSSVKQPKAPKKDPVVSTVEPSTETTTAKPDETEEKTSAPSETSEQSATQPVTTDAVFAASSADYFDDALFIGDSRTVGIKEYGTLDNADYFCSKGLASYKVDSEYIDGFTFSDKLSSNKYGKVYIMLGINEVAMDIEYIISQFRSLIETIRKYQPDAVIYIQANLHVTIAAQTENITNEGIDLLNYRLNGLADENDNVYFIDVNDVFDEAGTGALDPDYSSDGVHVLGKYYETWCEWLCQHTISDGSVQTAPAAATESSQEEDITEAYTEQSYYDESYDNSYESYDSYNDDSYYSDYDDEY